MNRGIVKKPHSGTRRSLVVFQVADQQYAVAAGDVAEIVPMAELHHPPGCPRVLAGFLDLGGDLIPVVRMHHLFGLPEVEPELWTPLLILHDHGRRLALWVDGVNRTLPVDDAAMLPLPSQHVNNDCVVGVVRDGHESLSLLSPQRLLIAEENRVVAELRHMVQQRLESLEGASA